MNEAGCRVVGFDPREISALVPVTVLLRALGFELNGRARRCVCILHGGSNPSSFSWRDDGRWHCFSCGRGGDRIALVRAARSCGFRQAVEYLAQLAGISYSPERRSLSEVAQLRARRQRAEAAAWRVRDEALRLRAHYGGGQHRAERLWRRYGEGLLQARTESEREGAWDRMSRLAPVCMFFLAAFDYLNRADDATLARFALAGPAERRAAILGEENGCTKRHAA